MTHINTKHNIFGDNIAEVQAWDFSKANLSDETRLEAVTTVASICYQNPRAVNSQNLYDRLLGESGGLPSSSFEFVPVLMDSMALDRLEDLLPPTIFWSQVPSVIKYGEYIVHEGQDYVITNSRALIADIGVEASKKFYNTEEECAIIAKYIKTFRFKVDLPTRSQMVRHRCSWQELSRRYVSANRKPFEFYLSEKMKGVESWKTYEVQEGGQKKKLVTSNTADDLISLCLNHYEQAIKDGVKPQEARRIIPQAAYTELWGQFLPSYYANFLKLRLDEHSQWETRQVAKAMQELSS